MRRRKHNAAARLSCLSRSLLTKVLVYLSISAGESLLPINKN